MSSGQTKRVVFIQNDPTDPPALVAQWLGEIGLQIEVIRADQGQAIPSELPSDVAALIPLGGHMGATEDEYAPWLPMERALIRSFVDAGRPVLGICLGTQLLGVACGGKVHQAEQQEIGIYPIAPTEVEDEIFGFAGEVPTTQWHKDEVYELPPSAVLLASSKSCRNQIYRIGKLTYGLQFHPEVDTAIIKSWEENGDEAFRLFGGTPVSEAVSAAQTELIATWEARIKKWGQAVLSA